MSKVANRVLHFATGGMLALTAAATGGCQGDSLAQLQASLVADPIRVDFGAARILRVKEKGVSLVNRSLDVAAIVTAVEMGGIEDGAARTPMLSCDNAEFTFGFCLVQPFPELVPADGNEVLALGCKPEVEEVTLEAKITVVSNAEIPELEIDMTCEGVKGGLPELVACLPGDAPPFGTGPDCTQPPPEDNCIHFGVTAIGAPSSRTAILTNVGSDPLFISQITFGPDSSDAFSIATSTNQGEVAGCPGDVADARPTENARGECPSAPLVVVYRPPGAGAHTGSIIVNSDDPSQPELEICLTGTGNNAPVAVAGDDRSTEPLATVELDGSESFDPDMDDPLVYEWSFPEDYPNNGRPAGSTTMINQVGAADCLTDMNHDPATCQPWKADFFVDLAGTYHVELRVRDAVGLYNVDREIVVIEAVPPQDLHIQLVWDNFQSDLDLHLVREGDPLFSAQDCYFANCSPRRPPGAAPPPSWCDPMKTTDDPSLDIDDIDGFGPENINIDEPCADTYHVYAHYWSSHGNPLVLSNATVRIYCNGVLRGEFFQPLTADEQLWDVGTVQWPNCVITEVGAVTTRPRGGL